VVVVRDSERRGKLAGVVGEQPWVRNAPVSLVFCLDFHRVGRWATLSGVTFRGHEAMMSFLIGYADLMCAAQTVTILAEERGLGSVYVGTVIARTRQAVELLELPEGVLPLMVLSLGYPVSRPVNIPKLPREVIAHNERYRVPSDAELEAAFEAKYGTIDENVERYFERAYVEVVEADKQHDDDWTAYVRERMERLNIRNSAQFLFELRYPQDTMVEFNEELLEDFRSAGFRFPGFGDGGPRPDGRGGVTE
jgi:FMN reductase [NAD(P)H]